MTTITTSIVSTRTSLVGLSLLTLGLVTEAARAELRCDCSQIVASCSADVNFKGSQVQIKSNTNACSRIDYLINGQPFTALVVDGSSRFDWSGQPQSSPQVIVESCDVCADGSSSRGSTATSSTGADTSRYNNLGLEDADPTQALVKIMPAYPRSALGRGIQGTVTVEFDITGEGVVRNIRVLEVSDIAFADSTIDVLAMETLEDASQSFVDATVDAVSRFRYQPEAAGSAKEQFSYRMLDNATPSVTSARL